MPVIEDLSEEEAYLWAILSDPSGLDQAEFLWFDPEQDDGCFRAWPFQWQWWRCEDTQQIDQCIAEGQLVTTINGYVPIENVETGHQVLTHKGYWREVVATHSNGSKPVMRVVFDKHQSLKTTGDHQLYCRVKSETNISDNEWITVSKIVELLEDFNVEVLRIDPEGYKIWVPIQSVADAGWSRVYDLSVEHDNSYTVERFAVHNCGRSVGKSLSIQVRAFAFPFLHPGQEMVVTAPEGNHLEAVTDNIEKRLLSSRVARTMLKGSNARGSIKHKPFHCNFENGSRIIGRIPQHDGKGIKGTHPLWLELDEAQDYPEKGWTEIFETVKRGSEGSLWRCHGVTRGGRDMFFKFTQETSGWKVHRFCAMHRPTWSDEERQTAIRNYTSREHPDYRRNVLGLHGDATAPFFVLNRLMACVDDNQASEYNTKVWTEIKISTELVEEYGLIENILDFPRSHTKYKPVWIGMDVGYLRDPSEILVFAEEQPKKTSESVLRLLSRISLDRVDHSSQADCVLWLIDFYKPTVFAMDKTGVGLPLYQDIQNRIEKNPRIKHMIECIRGYNFSQKILVDIDQSIEVDDMIGDPIKDAGVWRNVLEYSSDKLREMVDSKRIVLPWDIDLINEFKGQSFTYENAGTDFDQYGRRRRWSQGSFHRLDAARMAVLGWSQYTIEEMTSKNTYEGTSEVFLF